MLPRPDADDHPANLLDHAAAELVLFDVDGVGAGLAFQYNDAFAHDTLGAHERLIVLRTLQRRHVDESAPVSEGPACIVAPGRA
jgi:hypothetical protein